MSLGVRADRGTRSPPDRPAPAGHKRKRNERAIHPSEGHCAARFPRPGWVSLPSCLLPRQRSGTLRAEHPCVCPPAGRRRTQAGYMGMPWLSSTDRVLVVPRNTEWTGTTHTPGQRTPSTKTPCRGLRQQSAQHGGAFLYCSSAFLTTHRVGWCRNTTKGFGRYGAAMPCHAMRCACRKARHTTTELSAPTHTGADRPTGTPHRQHDAASRLCVDINVHGDVLCIARAEALSPQRPRPPPPPPGRRGHAAPSFVRTSAYAPNIR